jgi:hypothetical protein
MVSEVQYLASEAQFDEVREHFLKLAQSWTAVADTMARSLIERQRASGATTRD